MMTRKDIKLILTLVIGGIIFVSLYYYVLHISAENARKEELSRNREHEVSMVKALKNTYRNIKEIEISNPRYYNQKPGPSWHCSPTITFSDGFTIKYYISHSLDEETNRSAQIGGAGEKNEEKVRQLKNHYGDTKNIVTIYYSNGEKGEQ